MHRSASRDNGTLTYVLKPDHMWQTICDLVVWATVSTKHPGYDLWMACCITEARYMTERNIKITRSEGRYLQLNENDLLHSSSNSHISVHWHLNHPVQLESWIFNKREGWDANFMLNQAEFKSIINRENKCIVAPSTCKRMFGNLGSRTIEDKILPP